MLTNAFDSTVSLVYTGVGVLLILVLVHYHTTLTRFNNIKQTASGYKIPPVVPYYFPILGSFPYKYFTDPINFISTSP